ncbi:MAG: hypothetical protein M5U05_10985 [Anaerolineales bacterium]|nr:hypothetical protein [Anaerolineales bacterium]
MTLADQRSFWLVPPAKMNLEANQVHLWRAGLSRDPAAQQAAWAVLSDDERARAYRYRNDEDREHFIARRGILRALLGSYLKIPAAEVKFVYNPYGKPSLAAVSTIDPLQFNLSHSNGMALFGFAWSTRVGVDLERIQPDRGFWNWLRNIFQSMKGNISHNWRRGRRLGLSFDAGRARRRCSRLKEPVC